MRAEIVQFIPRPKRDDEQTDFPTIAFRSALLDRGIDSADTAAKRLDRLGKRET